MTTTRTIYMRRLFSSSSSPSSDFRLLLPPQLNANDIHPHYYLASCLALKIPLLCIYSHFAFRIRSVISQAFNLHYIKHY